MNLWNRVDPRGGLVLSARAANWLVSLLSQSGDHGGDRPVFKVGWRLDTRRKVLDDPADLAVLVDHVLAHGHRRVALLAGSLRETSGRERADAFLAALRRHGISTPDGYIAGDRWTQATGDLATRWILSTNPRPSALISSSVELALGALLACRDLGVRVPDDLALATFDDAYFAELLDPPLTAVAYDPADVGRRAAEVLVEAIRDPDSGPRRITVSVALVPRRSCGCAQ
jgi:DNA-binding LacI/PurR family transcriptional regulator